MPAPREDLDATFALSGDVDIQVPQPDVESNRGSGLSADAGRSTLEWPTPGAKDAGPRTCCNVVPQRRSRIAGANANA